MASLNPAQHAAVTHRKGPLLVLAGAGSGKTRVLTQRLVHLIRAERVDPGRILAVTFTNKAAREMLERTRQALASEVTPLISTFHSLGLRLLRRFHEAAGLPARFAIYDRPDQKALARRALSDARVDPDVFKPEKLMAFIEAQKTQGRTPAQAAGAGASYNDRRLARHYADYQALLRSAGAVDFEDLLLEPLLIANASPRVAEEMAALFDAVLVDEYQDTNENQYNLVRLLASRSANVTAVGDDDQSIYAWRGADSRNLRRFLADYPDHERVVLTMNYRSTGTILEAANAILRTIPDRMEKILQAAGPRGEPLRLFEAGDAPTEAARVAKDIKERAEAERLPWDAFGVLYRTNKQSEPLQEELDRARIPYRVVGGQKFLDRKEVKDLLAYLRVIAEPRDELALRRIWNTPARGLGPEAQKKLAAYAAGHRRPLGQSLGDAEEVGLTGKALAGALGLAALLTELRGRLARGEPFSALARELTTRLDYDLELARLYPEEKALEKKRAGLETLYEGMDRFKKRRPDGELSDYLAEMALIDELDRTKEEAEGRQVVLSTVHAAKGLEYPHVYLVGLEKGLFPIERGPPGAAPMDWDDEDSLELDEEKRLFYVAVTRARETLTISWCQQRGKDDRVRPTGPSRFLDLIPRELCRDLPAASTKEHRLERGREHVKAFLAQLKAGLPPKPA